MSQRDRMETKARHRHGPMWHDSDEARKAHLKETKYRKRAQRRLDRAVVEEETEMGDDLKLGATGEFPRGRMNKADEGETRIAIGHTAEGKIVLDFGKPTAWLGLDPEQAREMGALLLQHADEADKLRG